VLELHYQPVVNPIKIGNLCKRPKFARLRPLPIPRMERRNVSRAVPFSRNRRRNARVHTPAQKDNPLCFALLHKMICSVISVSELCVAFVDSYLFKRPW
jgi:hypothetical protein